MTSRQVGILMGFALVAVFLFAPGAMAQRKPVKLNKEWAGSVEDEKLAKEAPAVITNAKDLEKVWKAWKIADKMPEIDFTKEIVIVSTTVGSRLRLSAVLDDKGDLRILGLATRDLRPGFRYVIGTINKEGIKTIEGKELPK